MTASTTTRQSALAIPPPPDRALPTLATVLDGDAMVAILDSHLPDCALGAFTVESCRPCYVRHKPGTSCLVQYLLRLRQRATAAPVETLAHLRLYCDQRAEKVWQKRALARLIERAARHHSGPLTGHAAYLPALQAVVQIYPVDLDLPALVRATSPCALRRALGDTIDWMPDNADIELVRYKPGRKALLRCSLQGAEGDTVYVKLHADNRGAALFRAGQALHQGGLATPLPLAYLPSWRLLLHAEAPGRPLTELRDTPGFTTWIGPVVEMLTQLHAAGAVPLPYAAPTQEAAAVMAAGRAIAALLPAHAPWATRLAATIAVSLGEVAPVAAPIHGDFYDDQVLVGDAGAILLDLDEARVGHPLQDVGNFAAHLSARNGHDARAAFLDAYGGDMHAITRFEAAALLKLAVGPFRRLEADWPDKIERLAHLAEERLNERRPRRQAVLPPPPSDPALPQLTSLHDRALMAAELSRLLGASPVEVTAVTAVRHKPGRRCLLRYDLTVGCGADQRQEQIYGKTFASDRGPLVHTIIDAIASARACGARVQLPSPLGYLPALKLVVQQRVPGVPIAPRLLAGDIGLARQVAEAIHTLHRSTLNLPRRHDLARELGPLQARVARLSQNCPTLETPAWRCLELALALQQAGVAWRWCPIHRDFYHDQVLIGSQGLAILDFDDAALSEPTIDIANFLAHLRLLALQQSGGQPATLRDVTAAFAARACALDPEIDPLLLRRLEGATLLRLACIHQPRDGGRLLAERLLEASERLLLSGR